MVSLSEEQYKKFKKYARGVIPSNSEFEDILHETLISYLKYPPETSDFDEIMKILAVRLRQNYTKQYSVLTRVSKTERKYISNSNRIIYSDNLQDYEHKAVEKHNWYSIDGHQTSLASIKQMISEKRYLGMSKKRSSFKSKILSIREYPIITKKKLKNGEIREHRYTRTAVRVYQDHEKR